jgi:integrase
LAYVVKRGKRYAGYYRVGSKRLSAGSYDTHAQAMYEALGREQNASESRIDTFPDLASHLASWLQSAPLMPITRRGYQSVLDRHVLPRIGDRRVNEITKPMLKGLFAELRSAGVGNATIAQCKSALGSAFNDLVESERLTSNPTHGIKIKVYSQDFRNVLEPAEFRAVIAHLPTVGSQVLAKLLVVSGCRFGEATELRVRDLNFKTNELYVQRRVSEVGKVLGAGKRFIVVEATKSNHKRVVVLSKDLMSELRDYVLLNSLKKDSLLFSRTLVEPQVIVKPSRGAKSIQKFVLDGKQFQHGTLTAYNKGRCRCDQCKEMIRIYRQRQRGTGERTQKESSHLPRDVWRNIWNKAIAKSGIDWQPRTHDLRHANATQLLKNGVDLHEVKERLGHQSIKTTERYLHRLRHQRSTASELVNDFLER